MKKRLFCILLAFVLVFSLGVTGCAKKDKTSGTAITVESVTARAGKNVKIPVTLSGNPGIMALLIDFKFDPKVLEYVGFDKGKIFSDYEISDTDGNLRLICVENEDVKGNGELLTLEFKVKSKDVKETEVSVEIVENSICNYNEELIAAKGKNGTVKIK